MKFHIWTLVAAGPTISHTNCHQWMSGVARAGPKARILFGTDFLCMRWARNRTPKDPDENGWLLQEVTPRTWWRSIAATNDYDRDHRRRRGLSQAGR
jgi:hypothetical protein